MFPLSYDLGFLILLLYACGLLLDLAISMYFHFLYVFE